MEVFFLLAGFLLGAAAVLAGATLLVMKERTDQRKGQAEGETGATAPPVSEEDEEVPQYIKVQFENFMSYDGTGRGQKQLDDL